MTPASQPEQNVDDAEGTVPTEADVVEPSRAMGPGGSDDIRRWASLAAQAAASKTDADVVVLEVAPVLAIVEYFVIAAGRNPRQVRSIADEVEEQVARAGGPRPKRIEGRDAMQWVLMDYGDFVVHVFHEDMRTFYDLERLWADVARVDWRAIAGAPEALDDAGTSPAP